MNNLLYGQGALELLFLVINSSFKIIFYRILMLYFIFKTDQHLFKDQTNEKNDKKEKLNLGIQQILITFSFFFLHNQPHQILKEFVCIQLMHLLILKYPNAFTFCESYALSQFLIEYFKLEESLMFGYLSEIVLMLAVVSFFIIVLLSKIPIKELSITFILIAILKINFFSIFYYLQYRGHSLSILINEIISSNFRWYFGIQFLLLLLILPISRVKTSNINKRKLFHFQISLIILVGLKLNISYTKLALAVFLWLFIILEGLRQNFRKQLPILQTYSNFMLSFCDKRDSEQLIITHIYLMIGVSHSIFLNDLKLVGVFILGIGDSFAAIIGSTIGRIKYYNSNRTLEGSLAFLLSSTLGHYLYNGEFKLYLISCIVEAYTSQIDNLILPKIQLNPLINSLSI